MAKVSEKLLSILECPMAHVPLVQSGEFLYSTDRKTRRKYPVRDGIPVVLIDESVEADADEFERVMAEANIKSPTNS